MLGYKFVPMNSRLIIFISYYSGLSTCWGIQPVHDNVGGRRPTSDLNDGRVSNAPVNVEPSLTFAEQL